MERTEMFKKYKYSTVCLKSPILRIQDMPL